MATRLHGPRDELSTGSALPPRRMAAIAASWATTVDVDSLLRPAAGQRTHRRLLDTDRYDVWLIRWGAGSSAPLHDHAGSARALRVVEGVLREEHADRSPAPVVTTIGPARGRVFGRGHVHEVRNDSADLAASIHVYSPPLRAMTYYARTSGPVPLPLYRTAVDDLVP